MNATIKPCDIPCPKCGGTDIWREFHEKGSFLDEPYQNNFETIYKGFVKRKLYENPEATKDFITHHCRVCGFDWATPPLEQL